MRIHFIDVGQGAATLFEFPCGAVLIDTGGEKDSKVVYDSTPLLTGYLDRFFERRSDLNHTLALLLLTHPHPDHTMGAPAVMSRYHVNNLVDDGWSQRGPQGLPQQHKAEQAEAASGGHYEAISSTVAADGRGKTDAVIDPLNCSGVSPKIEVLWGLIEQRPAGWTVKKDFKNPNNHSVVVRIDYGKASVLVTGDLEKRGIQDLLSNYAGTGQLDADIYEVGHHGSNNATTADLLKAMTPKIAVMEVGSPDRQDQWTAWTYGHPRKSTIDLLQAAVERTRPTLTAKVATGKFTFVDQTIKEAIYATAWDGNVVIDATADGAYTVQTHQ